MHELDLACILLVKSYVLGDYVALSIDGDYDSDSELDGTARAIDSASIATRLILPMRIHLPWARNGCVTS